MADAVGRYQPIKVFRLCGRNPRPDRVLAAATIASPLPLRWPYSCASLIIGYNVGEVPAWILPMISKPWRS